MMDLQQGKSGKFEVTGATEVVLVLVDTEYTPGVTSLDSKPVTEAVRFTTTPGGLRHIAKALNGYADDAEQLVRMVRMKTDDELEERDKQ